MKSLEINVNKNKELERVEKLKKEMDELRNKVGKIVS
jgi:hypothetical protein